MGELSFNNIEFTQQEADKLSKLMPNETLCKFVLLRYKYGCSLDETAELMNYSKRHIERMGAIATKTALKILLKNDSCDFGKIAEIRRIADSILTS